MITGEEREMDRYIHLFEILRKLLKGRREDWMMIRLLRWMFGSRIILDQHNAKGTKRGGGVW